jgi:tetratricopeptide (TPR) repeat protein
LHIGYANVLLLTNDSARAVEEFKEAANLNQQDPSPHRALGAFYIAKREFGKAAKEYTRALNISPTSVKDLVALGFCYAENDDFMQAEAAFVTALALQQLNGSNPSPDDPSRLDVMRSLACLFYDERRYGDAAAQFENIIAIYRDKGATKEDALLLAKSKMMRDLSEAAAAGVVQCLEVLAAERQESFRLSVVEAMLEAGKYRQAKRLLETIPVEMRQDNLAYALYDGACLRQSGKLADALSVVSKAEPLAETAKAYDPSMAARLLCERARIELAQSQPAEAEKSAKKSLALYEKCYPAHLVLGQIYLSRGENQAAIDAGRKALELNPYYAPAYLLQGEAQAKMGASKEALESCKKAVELYPGWLDAHKALLGGYRKLALTSDAKQEEAQISKMEALR